jgi:hypothetical protein
VHFNLKFGFLFVIQYIFCKNLSVHRSVAYYASFVLSIVKIFSCFKTKLSFQNQVFFEPTIPNLHNLTPKGPNVHMVDKPVLVSVT